MYGWVFAYIERQSPERSVSQGANSKSQTVAPVQGKDLQNEPAFNYIAS